MKTRLFIAAAGALALAGCVSDGGYYASDRYYDDDYDRYGYDARYGDRYDRVSYMDRCFDCGVVERIERYYDDGRTSGVGAVTGAVVGGALGSQVGSGSGRRAATVAGAVIGGIAGNEIEEEHREGTRYDVYVRMNDGRRVVVSQRELDGVREGTRVRVSGGRAFRI
jgi:outer membrane lipoprotein SlyB